MENTFSYEDENLVQYIYIYIYQEVKQAPFKFTV